MTKASQLWPPSTMQGADYPPFPMWPWTGTPTSAPGSRHPPPLRRVLCRVVRPQGVRGGPGARRTRRAARMGRLEPAISVPSGCNCLLSCVPLARRQPLLPHGFLPAPPHGWRKRAAAGSRGRRPAPCQTRTGATPCCDPGSRGTAAVLACGVRQPRIGGGFRVRLCAAASCGRTRSVVDAMVFASACRDIAERCGPACCTVARGAYPPCPVQGASSRRARCALGAAGHELRCVRRW